MNSSHALRLQIRWKLAPDPRTLASFLLPNSTVPPLSLPQRRSPLCPLLVQRAQKEIPDSDQPRRAVFHRQADRRLFEVHLTLSRDSCQSSQPHHSTLKGDAGALDCPPVAPLSSQSFANFLHIPCSSVHEPHPIPL